MTMTVKRKQALVEKYGPKVVNGAFLRFLKGKSVAEVSDHYGLEIKIAEDLIRVNFFALDSVIMDQKQDIEGLEILVAAALAKLPEDTRKKLIKKYSEKK